MNDNNIINNELEKNKKSNKGLLQNIYFVGFLLVLSILDCVRHAINEDYKIVNLVFIAFTAFLFYKLIKAQNKSQP